MPETYWSVADQRLLYDARQIGSRAHVLNFRAAKDWTQAQAADWYGCSERSWRRYESGERRVPGPLLKRIASYRWRR